MVESKTGGGTSRKRLWLALAGVFITGLTLGALFLGGEAPAPTDSVSHDQDAGKETVWTCSMHPQIKLPAPGQCPICFMDLIPLENDDASTGDTQLSMSPEAMKLAEVTTVTVTRGVAEATVRTVGKVAVDERRVKKIAAWVGGRLDRLYVDYTGVEVRKGAPLAEIYSPELYSAQVELIEALKTRQELASSGSGLIRETSEATVEAARDKLRLLGLRDRQITEIESRGEPNEHVAIYAPVGGVVVHKQAVEGDYVRTGSPIYTIAELSQVWVIMDVYESDLMSVKTGQSVEFEVNAFPGVPFEGRIAFIDPVVNPATRTVKVRIDAENPGLRLKPDMFVHAVIRSGSGAGRGEAELPLLIPATAPLMTGKRAVVYVKVPGTDKPTFEGREVVLGPRAGDRYIVRSGLAEGEEVVVKGNFKIDSAMQIQAKPSMMSPAGGAPAPGHRHGEAPTAVGGSGHEGHAATEMSSAKSLESLVPELRSAADRFAGATGPLYESYFELQGALAADDAKAAGNAAQSLRRAVDGLKDKAPSGKAGTAFTEWSEAAGEAADAVPGRDLADMRRAFDRVTGAVLVLERAVGPPAGQNHHLLFCPMAFDNRGASWIQNNTEVRNPYFGASMLKCGEVRETFGPAGDAEPSGGTEQDNR